LSTRTSSCSRNSWQSSTAPSRSTRTETGKRLRSYMRGAAVAQQQSDEKINENLKDPLKSILGGRTMTWILSRFFVTTLVCLVVKPYFLGGYTLFVLD
jgi:hypothetical protein